MKKTPFLTTATIFLATIAVPAICMEVSSPTTITPKEIVVTLGLTKEYINLYSPIDDKRSEYFWKHLGYQWKKGDHSYSVDYAFVKSPNKSHALCWKYNIPKDLPASTIPNPSMQHLTKEHSDIPHIANYFTSHVPDDFGKELLQQKSIIREGIGFEKPVVFKFSLEALRDNSMTPSCMDSKNLLDPFDRTYSQYLAQNHLVSILKKDFNKDFNANAPYPHHRGLQFFAQITDMDNIRYTCWLKDERLQVCEQKNDKSYKVINWIKVCEQKNNGSYELIRWIQICEQKDNGSYSFIQGCRDLTFKKQHSVYLNKIATNQPIEEEEEEKQEEYAYLLKIADNQWVIMDKDYKFYIRDEKSKSKHPLQSTKNNNIVLIKLSQKDLLNSMNEDSKKNQNMDDNTEKSQTNSTFKTYIIPVGLTTAIGIFAYIMYLYQNNQLDTQLSRMTDFIHNVINR